MVYRPQKNAAEILTWCLEQVKSVPYRVTLRWAFYRAMQSRGLIKEDYRTRFKPWVTRARKNFWNGWAPDTLVDDTRVIVKRGFGYETPRDWIDGLRNEECVLDKRLAQPKIIIVCFEAMAMFSQFDHYTKDFFVTLVPFKGDHTIEPKWNLAKYIEYLHEHYGKPVKILYFGDLDLKGKQIPKSAENDIRRWCKVDFEWVRVGLNEEHTKRWTLPDNPKKPGEYQWEALDDEAARELIQGSLERETDRNAIVGVLQREKETTELWRNKGWNGIKTDIFSSEVKGV